MVYINEWLPNPVGRDEEGEWVELFNDGEQEVYLSGWALKNQSGKTVYFRDEIISAQGYLVLPRARTRLTLRNRDEHLFLYSRDGTLVDHAVLLGSAREGKSMVRRGEEWGIADPTPGAVNRLDENIALIESAFSPQVGSGGIMSFGDIGGLALMCGILFGTLFFFLIRNDYAVSKLFFK